mmetsp:Transcript_27040/g.64218  ORF Transcript_27040/g.64218 Transcript_27040/m.64218 type:complete len:213 (-) Transcript_27040:198-836(-)
MIGLSRECVSGSGLGEGSETTESLEVSQVLTVATLRLVRESSRDIGVRRLMGVASSDPSNSLATSITSKSDPLPDPRPFLERDREFFLRRASVLSLFLGVGSSMADGGNMGNVDKVWGAGPGNKGAARWSPSDEPRGLERVRDPPTDDTRDCVVVLGVASSDPSNSLATSITSMSDPLVCDPLALTSHNGVVGSCRLCLGVSSMGATAGRLE